MLSTAADLASLAQVAPWAAVGLLSLLASAWVYRQSRRGQAAAEARTQLSAVRQGKRLGDVEKVCGLLDLRRRQVEWELLSRGIDLPHWPPDGPDQPAPAPRYRDDPRDDYRDDVDQADDDVSPTAFRPSVPPLPEMARHRRSATP